MNEDRPSNGSPPPPPQRNWLGRLSQLLVGEPRDRGDLIEVLRDAQRRELLDSDALKMIEAVLQVSDMRAEDIMIPRSQMVIVNQDDPPQALIKVALESGHSRFPVVGDSRDEVVGILLAKDLLAYTGDSNGFDVRDLLRPAVYIPESKRVDALLKEFRSSRNHLAVVVDEYGGVAGIVTIEDVLEQIVGDIEDEHDLEEDSGIHRHSDNLYTLPAVTEIEEFNAHFGSDFSDAEVDTVGGLVINALGHLPKRGETCQLGRYSFRVTQADSRRILALQLTVLDEASHDEAADGSTAGGG